MLYIDGLSLSKLREEFSSNLCGRKISKISQYDHFSISLFLNKINLFISINPSLPITYISEKNHESPHAPMPFLLTLRKYILGGIVRAVKQIDFDRILIINIEKLTELGELVEYNLIFEIMGKHSNLILTDKTMKIIDILKKFSLDEGNLRIMMPGVHYKRPVLSQKTPPNEVTKDFFDKEIKSTNDIIMKIEGLGKYSSNEILKDALPDYELFKALLDRAISPTVYIESSQQKKPIFGSVFEVNSYSNNDKIKFSDISGMINYYIENTIKSQQINAMKTNLQKLVSNEIKKNERTLVTIKREAESEKDFEFYKQLGDILAANLYQLKRNMKNITLLNFYSNEEVNISLNPDISPQENLAAYYKKYNRFKTKAEYNAKRIIELNKENEYLESVFYSMEAAENQEVLRDIETELSENNYIKKIVRKEKKKNTKPELKQYLSSEGFIIYAGRNNKENDYITFKIATKDDFWFHAKNIPGSHVVLKVDSSENELTDISIAEAASIAASYSKGKFDTSVTVDYTKRKYVVKPNGSNPGFVTYTHEKSINIKPKL